MVLLVLEEEMFVGAIGSEGNGGITKTREESFEVAGL
jgi:hypothetical protein